MRGVRTLLTGFLLVAAFLLSFGALRHRALTAGIIHGDLGLPLLLAHVTISAHTLAGVWALTLDGLTAVGVLGVRDPGLRDWRAWAALIGGLGLSLRFQVSGYDSWEARGMAAVPPLALAMAVWIFEVGRPQPDLAEPADLGMMEDQQAELETKIEAERIRLEEQWEKARLRRQVHRARERAIQVGAPVVDFTVEDWLALLEGHEYRCAYCNADDLALLIEHRTPLSRGGEHTRSNIVPACEPCNLNKADKTEEEWETHRATQTEAERTAQAALRVRHRERPPRRQPTRQRVTQGASQRTVLSEGQRAEVARRVAQGESARSISQDLGLSHRGYKHLLLPLVRELRASQPVGTPGSPNGDEP